MTVAQLPIISINCGQVWNGDFTVKGVTGVGINLTSWTGKFSVGLNLRDTPLLQVTPASMTADGLVTVSLTATQTATLQAYIDQGCMKFQLDVDANDNSDAHRLEGDVELCPEMGA